MPAERIAMRLVREILRLIAVEKLSVREVARRTGKAPSTVRATLGRCRAAGVSWPLPEGLSDGELEERLYGKGGAKPGPARRAEPDWASIHRELKRKHVTLSILWEEYIAQEPDGLRYSRFCELYRTFASKLPVVMRQTHAAGEKLFVDYAGDTVPVIVDRLTGEWRPAQIFVAVLGASSFSYAEATWTQSLPDWIAAHVRALEAIGGVPRLLVPDNPKAAIVKACFYDPQVNRTYSAFAEHYDIGVLPARPRKPRDKAKVEACVLIVERYLLGRLRHRIFYSLAELNQAIQEMLADINGRRPLRRLGVTRQQLFEDLDRPALKPLPVEPYVYAEWRIRRAGLDYHVEVEDHYYSVPFRFAKDELGRAPHGAHGGGVPQGRAHRRPSPQLRQSPPHDDARAHAVEPPALRRLVHRAHPPRGLGRRPLDRRVVRADPGRAPPSRAGLPRLPRHHPARQVLRPRAGRGGLLARP